MFVIVGATGKTGSAALDALLRAGHPVRGVVRRADQADRLRHQGADAAIVDVDDIEALTPAFAGADAVYLMNPPAYHDPDMFARAHAVHAALIAAAERAKVGRIVALSSVGAQHAADTGNILTTHDFEQQLRKCPLPVTVLRAANFIDNWAYAIGPAIEKGVLPSFFLPLERALPMQFSADVGTTAAALMVEGGGQRRTVDLHGPADVSPDDTARALRRVLDRPIKAVPILEADWPAPFRKRGLPERTVAGYCAMFAGFNSGHIAFSGADEVRRGPTGLEEALRLMVASHAQEPAAGK